MVPKHDAAAGPVCSGADSIAEPSGDYVGCVRAPLEAGSPNRGAYLPRHEEVREALRLLGAA